MMTYSWEDVKGYSAGDIVTLGGKRYRLQKKTTTACAVVRHYWFDSALEWIGRFIGNGMRP